MKNKKRETLVILGKIAGIDPENISYFIANVYGCIVEDFSQSNLKTIAKLAVKRNVIVLVPTEQVFITKIFLPKMSRKKMLKAIPYALEEQLADNIDELLFFPGDRDETGKVSVAVIHREVWKNYAVLLSCINVDKMLPTVLTLPHEKNTWTAWIDEQSVLLRIDKNVGVHIDRENFSLACNALMSLQPQKIELYGEKKFVQEIKEMLSVKDVLTEIDNQPIDFYDFFARGLADHASINLISNHHAQTIKKFFLPFVKYSFVFFITTISVHTAYLEIQRFLNHQTIEHLSSRMQLDKALSREQQKASGGEFFYLLAKLGMVLHRVGTAQLRTIDFQKTVMIVSIRFFDPQKMIQIEKQWKSEGLVVKKIQYVPHASYVEVSYQINEALR